MAESRFSFFFLHKHQLYPLRIRIVFASSWSSHFALFKFVVIIAYRFPQATFIVKLLSKLLSFNDVNGQGNRKLLIEDVAELTGAES